MTPEEINYTLQSAGHGYDKIVSAAKHNICNATALLVRNVLGNKFTPSVVIGELSTVPVKVRHMTFDQLVASKGGAAPIPAEEVLNIDDILVCYREAMRVARNKRDELIKERES